MGSSKIFFFHDGVKRQPHQSNKSCAIAGETEVAEQRLSPVQLVGHVFVDRIRKETDRRKLGNSFQNGSPTWRRSHQPERRQIPAGRISALEHDAMGRNPLRALLLRQKRAGVRTSQPGARAHSRNGKDRGALEKQASSQVAGKKLEAQLQSCMKQTRANRQSLKLKATLSKVRFWDADGNRLMGPPAELRGRKALLTIEVRQLWIMGQQCGLLMEARDIKLQDASPPECPL